MVFMFLNVYRSIMPAPQSTMFNTVCSYIISPSQLCHIVCNDVRISTAQTPKFDNIFLDFMSFNDVFCVYNLFPDTVYMYTCPMNPAG